MLTRSFTRIGELLDFLGLDHRRMPGLDPQPQPFDILVPRGFARLMRYGDPNDPLLRQVLPLRLEKNQVPGFVTDPVADGVAERTPGLLQKYQGRALLVATGACAIHCRYCFRRHFPYKSLGAITRRWDKAIAEIEQDSSLSEIVLSGGDPLMLTDASVSSLVQRLGQVPHLRRLRLHTRLPVVLPQRITHRLVEILSEGRLPCVMVIHVNHPRELGEEAHEALARLHLRGIKLLNQSVLLRGVNDDADTLIKLSERLFECGVLPYYLHQLDPVAGAAHFQVPEQEARLLIDTMREQTSGYLIPRLVREVSGAPSKVPLT